MAKNPLSYLSSWFDPAQPGRRKIIQSIKAKANAKRTHIEKLADWITSRFGTMTFFTLNLIWFTVWLLINTGKIAFIAPFDPFPFSLLTTAVSLEAIMLAIFVLISQNRSMKVDDLREEIHLQVNLIAEREITKIMQMMAILLEKHGVDLSEDSELKKLLRPISAEELEKRLEKEIL